MDITLESKLSTIVPEQWNALEGGIDSPFLRHEFLAGLEQHGCVGKHWGWLPQHLLLWDKEQLIGALPMYLKDNSYGEFVFDMAWADAYRRAGLDYYPKLVVSVPYTPATGPRLLTVKDERQTQAKRMLVDAALEHAQTLGISSLHFLFTTESDTQQLTSQGLMRRTGCQYHWQNQNYRDFDDYLEQMTSRRRKEIRRERRRVREASIEIEILNGHQATEQHWDTFYHFYTSTFEKYYGHATLSKAFFKHLGKSLPDSVVLVLARHEDRYVAGALNLCSGDTLYGRHWGCDAQFHSLHFEACYYTGIEYCIKHGLKYFEPGAQGEHKVWRGFLPRPTWSAHWLAEPMFADAVKDFLKREEHSMQSYMQELAAHSPFKSETAYNSPEKSRL
ncbi:MAG: N-acetyltransferase [Gammaproteobacteria bacterium]|nr:N-acetyltransferase [Gammaproteobacteria bacterium]